MTVRDDEVLHAIRPRARQLLVVLIDAPLKLLVEVVEKERVERVVILSEHVHDGVQCVVARGCHPL